MKLDTRQHCRTRDAIDDEAAAWVDALQGNEDPAARQAFERWQAQDAAHREAYERTVRAYAMARASVPSAQRLVAMENEILARAATQAGRGKQRRAIGIAASLLTGVAALYGVTGGSWSELHYLKDRALHAMAGDTLYRTAVGERLVVTLDDGSVLTLNTNSRALVRYRDGIRGVNLFNGQALFEVAKDPLHPFVVTAGGRKVTALGTAFDVRTIGTDFSVTLIEGRVAIETASADARIATRTELSAGEQLTLAPSRIEPVVRRTDVKRSISWRHGQVIFDNDPLAGAVREINRYGKRTVVLTDQRLADMRVSGAFNTSDTGVFIDMLTVYLPVKVVETTDEKIVLGYREG